MLPKVCLFQTLQRMKNQRSKKRELNKEEGQRISKLHPLEIPKLTEKDCTVDRFSSIVKAKSFVELISHIEEGIENGQFIFKLSELHTLYVNRLKSLQCGQQINKTRLKQHLLTHFSQR